MIYRAFSPFSFIVADLGLHPRLVCFAPLALFGPELVPGQESVGHSVGSPFDPLGLPRSDLFTRSFDPAPWSTFIWGYDKLSPEMGNDSFEDTTDKSLFSASTGRFSERTIFKNANKSAKRERVPMQEKQGISTFVGGIFEGGSPLSKVVRFDGPMAINTNFFGPILSTPDGF